VTALYAVLETQWAPTERGTPRAHKNQQTQHMDVLKALLAAGAEPNPRLRTHLYHFAGAQTGLNATGATPFWRAALAQDVEAMRALVAHGADPHIPTIWPEVGMRADRQQDGRQRDDSDLPRAEGQPAVYPIHAAAGGGYLGLGSDVLNSVPNNFLNAVKFMVEEQGADANLPDSWGYTPLHYAAVRGGNDVIEYLVTKGADVSATTVLGQSPVDMARGGRAGFFERAPYPETIELLTKLGSPMKCLNTLFRGTGDYCEGTEVPQLTEEDRGTPSRRPGARAIF
jgi:ankyrin repeat protein